MTKTKHSNDLRFPSFNFSEGLAKYRGSNNKIGFIDTKGNIIIPPKFDHAGSFHNGQCIFEIKLTNDKSKVGSILKDGTETNFNLIIKSSLFLYEPIFSHGLYRIHGKFYDENGNIFEEFKHLKGLDDFNSDGLAEVYDGGVKAFVINRDGDEVNIVRHGEILSKIPHPSDSWFYTFHMRFLTTQSNGIYFGCYEKKDGLNTTWYNYYKYDQNKKIISTFNDSHNNFKFSSPMSNGFAYGVRTKINKGAILNTKLRDTIQIPRNWESYYWNKVRENIMTVKSKKDGGLNFYNFKTNKIILSNNLNINDVVVEPTYNQMVRIQEDISPRWGRFQYLNMENPSFISKKYEDANNYSEDIACVFNGKEYQYIDKDENIIFKFI